jgi:hypothetical protein
MTQTKLSTHVKHFNKGKEKKGDYYLITQSPSDMLTIITHWSLWTNCCGSVSQFYHLQASGSWANYYLLQGTISIRISFRNYDCLICRVQFAVHNWIIWSERDNCKVFCMVRSFGVGRALATNSVVIGRKWPFLLQFATLWNGTKNDPNLAKKVENRS